jgi:hypothetical protein
MAGRTGPPSRPGGNVDDLVIENYGFIQASDRLEGDFTEQDEANLVRLHLPGCREKVGT